MTTEATPTEAATTTEGSAEQSTGTTATAAETTGQTQQATEGQPSTEAVKAEADPSKTEGEQAKKPEGAPEKYEFTAPEGHTFDGEVIGKFSEVAKELNLPQGDAQKILDQVAPVIQARQTEALQAVRAEWQGMTKADKEFGGDKLDENLAVAKKAMETFGTPELRTLLNDSGLGDHPEIIRAFFRAGKQLSEDNKFVGGAQGESTPKSAAQRMYPNMNP